MRDRAKPPIRLMPYEALARERALRRNQTPAETKLWRLLHSRRLGEAKFRRNHPIGKFFADFCCIKSRLVIEVDGGQHAEEAEAQYDQRRTVYLESCGFRVLRFWNNEVSQEPERVVEQIREALDAAENRTLTLTLSRNKAGEGPE